MDDLFDFSGGAEAISAGSKHRRRESNDKPNSASLSKPTTKPSRDDVEMKDGDLDSSSEDDDQDATAGPSTRPRKRARKHEPAPVVLDEFETEAKRELPVNAGLSASVEGDSGSLLLTHQVHHELQLRERGEGSPFLTGQTSSRGAARLQLHSDIPTCISRRTRPCISLQT